jgi:hypothetical protein
MKKSEFNQYMELSKFRTVFNELGWNNASGVIKYGELDLMPIANKCGMYVFTCNTNVGFTMIAEIKKTYHHFIIIRVSDDGEQRWYINCNQFASLLIRSSDFGLMYGPIQNLMITMAEEEAVTIVDVVDKVSRFITDSIVSLG